MRGCSDLVFVLGSAENCAGGCPRPHNPHNAQNAEADLACIRFRMIYYLPGWGTAIDPSFAVSEATTCDLGDA